MKVLLSSLLQPIICPVPDMPSINARMSPCPKTDTLSPALGCILPPQQDMASLAHGVTWGDMVCCSFLEEDMSRTNCLIEREMYTLFGEFIDQGDTVLEVGDP